MFIPQRNNPDYVAEDEWNVPPAPPPPPAPLRRSVGTMHPPAMVQIVDRRLAGIDESLTDITDALNNGAANVISNMSKIYHVGDGTLLPYEYLLAPIDDFNSRLDETIVKLQGLPQRLQATIDSINAIRDGVSDNLTQIKIKYPLQEQLRPVVQKQIDDADMSFDELDPATKTAVTGNANGGRTKRKRQRKNKTRRRVRR